MDRAEALARLPELYALALNLRDSGLDYEAIADRLGIAPESVGPCLEVAQAKLATLIAAEHP